ncbi:hypothetical protein F8S13_26885 [Chloroflexia bacterium SDU3-3]|nr:hypothetical protein F8S13_26885 [Chloroflexia bacterium SDU3-3]
MENLNSEKYLPTQWSWLYVESFYAHCGWTPTVSFYQNEARIRYNIIDPYKSSWIAPLNAHFRGDNTNNIPIDYRITSLLYQGLLRERGRNRIYVEDITMEIGETWWSGYTKRGGGDYIGGVSEIYDISLLNSDGVSKVIAGKFDNSRSAIMLLVSLLSRFLYNYGGIDCHAFIKGEYIIIKIIMCPCCMNCDFSCNIFTGFISSMFQWWCKSTSYGAVLQANWEVCLDPMNGHDIIFQPKP